MRKKSMAHTNELLPDVLFSVSPFLIEVAHPVEQIFTLNFEKGKFLFNYFLRLPDRRINVDNDSAREESTKIRA